LRAFLGCMSIRYRVDQIIGGTVINFFALGMTSYLTARVLVEYPNLNEPGSFRAFGIPGLDRIPFLGPLLFDNTIYVYLLFLLVFGLWWALFRTRWGLRVRSVGEHPRAADTVGITVIRTRYRAVMLGGAVAGLGGTWFTLDAVSSFDENMTAGRGFIALAALIFGRWHPVGAFIAALVFAFSEELQNGLAVLDTPIPSEFLLMLPYVVTIIVVAGLVGRSRPPAADGQVSAVERAPPCPPDLRSTGTPCAPPPGRRRSARTPPTRTSGSAPPGSPTTGASSSAATSRTPRTGSRCVQSAGSSPPSTPAVAVGWSRWRCPIPTAAPCRRAAAAGSCSTRAADPSWASTSCAWRSGFRAPSGPRTSSSGDRHPGRHPHQARRRPAVRRAGVVLRPRLRRRHRCRRAGRGAVYGHSAPGHGTR